LTHKPIDRFANWENFKLAARLGEPEQIPVGLIVDSPWLPGYAGIDTREYYLFPDKWLEINLNLLERFPNAVWIPGFWLEYGMAAEANFDVFNFSHKLDIAEVKAKMGHRVALMGNVPPLDVGVRGTPAEVAQSARECLDKGAPGGGMILSFGGGVSPGTPPENIDALLEVARDWPGPSPI
jgi:uroporphyrinogen-III decarboxylase